jgi:hypothetical protein
MGEGKTLPHFKQKTTIIMTKTTIADLPQANVLTKAPEKVEAQKLQYEISPYSSVQEFMYKEALFGLRIYSKEDLETMSPKKKQRIEDNCKQAQFLINRLKQKRVISLTNKIFSCFNNSKLLKDIISEYSTTVASVQNTMSTKELGITKEDIIKEFLKHNVLTEKFIEHGSGNCNEWRNIVGTCAKERNGGKSPERTQQTRQRNNGNTKWTGYPKQNGKLRTINF